MAKFIVINIIGFILLTAILILAILGGHFGWWWHSDPPTDNMEPLAQLYGYSSNQDVPRTH